jgi:hypothetical protein
VNSKSYQKLRELSTTIHINTAWFSPHKEYNQLAVYLSFARFSIAWTVVDLDGNTLKDKTLELVPGLLDSEWMEIQEHMLYIAVNDSPIGMMALRRDWVRALDTLREFERE